MSYGTHNTMGEAAKAAIDAMMIAHQDSDQKHNEVMAREWDEHRDKILKLEDEIRVLKAQNGEPKHIFPCENLGNKEFMLEALKGYFRNYINEHPILLFDGFAKKITAIKFVRANCNMGLLEAKNYVEDLMDQTLREWQSDIPF